MPAVVSTIATAGVSGTPFDGIDNSQGTTQVWFTITPSGAYAALGDILDLTPLIAAGVAESVQPFDVTIKSFNPAGDSGFIYKFRPGTTLANGKFQVMTSNGAAPNPLLDLGAGAYPAGVLNDKIIGWAVFVRL